MIRAETLCSSCHTAIPRDTEISGVCPACAFALALEPPVEEDGGEQRIGPYHLRERIGEGGMGEVWLAEQETPVRRQVAIKLIKVGMDTKQVVARFEAERQALALMDHPSVSKVFDAGSTAEGRPFFVMEHVSGLPITEHADRHRLTTLERIALFLPVCEAVQHAHHKGILHRDLKPSNVLVTQVDGVALPKVIDFGVAKALLRPLTDKSLHTEVGAFLGTPEYMSPEQADLTERDVDTRTDVYGLGVLFYELLVGTLPFDAGALREGGSEALRRMIREVEPPKPSTRLGTLGGEKPSQAAERRRVDVPTLRRQLRGELDWIAMKALEKERDRRYGSPAELAADLRRYLAHEPVLAGPPSAAYRTRKFVRRHRFGVGAAVIGVAALVAFAVTTTVQSARIAREARAKQRVSQFLTEIFTVSDPSAARGNSVTAREILDRGAARIRESLTGDPAVRAELMHTLGTVYVGLGLFPQAEPLLKEALDARRDVLGTSHPDTLRTASELGRVLQMQEGREVEAEALLSGTVPLLKSALGPEHPDTLRAMGNLARAVTFLKGGKEAEPLFRELLAIQKRVLGPDHVETLRSMHGLGLAVENQAKCPEAEAIFKDTLERRRRVLGPDHPHTLNSMMHLALMHVCQDRPVEAEAVYAEMLPLADRVLGRSHFDTLWIRFNRATVAAKDGRKADAYALLRDAVADGFGFVEHLEQPELRDLLAGPELDAIVAGARENAARAQGAK